MAKAGGKGDDRDFRPFAGPDMRVGEHVVNIVDRAAGNADRFQPGKRLLAGDIRQVRRQRPVERVPVGDALAMRVGTMRPIRKLANWLAGIEISLSSSDRKLLKIIQITI